MSIHMYKIHKYKCKYNYKYTYKYKKLVNIKNLIASLGMFFFGIYICIIFI